MNSDFKKNKYIVAIETDDSAQRFFQLLDAITSICELADFHVEGRIVLKDKRTGKIWR